MYTLEFNYSDKRYYCYERVEQVTYLDMFGETIEVIGDEILKHKFPLNSDLHLLSKDPSRIVSSEKLQSILVSRN